MGSGEIGRRSNGVRTVLVLGIGDDGGYFPLWRSIGALKKTRLKIRARGRLDRRAAAFDKPRKETCQTSTCLFYR